MAKKRSTGFAGRLRQLREAAGLTQLQLAERADMHLHGITKLEQGDREPSWATVLDLARALDVGCQAFEVGGLPGEGEAAVVRRGRGRPSKATSAPSATREEGSEHRPKARRPRSRKAPKGRREAQNAV